MAWFLQIDILIDNLIILECTDFNYNRLFSKRFLSDCQVNIVNHSISLHNRVAQLRLYFCKNEMVE